MSDTERLARESEATTMERITTEQRVLDFLALYDCDEVAFTLESLTELLLAAEKAAVSEADADWRAVIERECNDFLTDGGSQELRNRILAAYERRKRGTP